MNNEPIGLFDSGIGGLTVLSECRKILPSENYIYLADFKNAPYGNKSADEILVNSINCLGKLNSFGVKAAVIACNTATNAGAAELRKRFSFPIIGMEPAVKPAYENLKDGNILVLCTTATSVQEKFKALISKFDTSKIIVSPQKELAVLIEKNIYSLENIRQKVYEILSQYFGVSAVVLGCTHYVLIKKFIHSYYQGNINIYDGNAGAAKRLKNLLGDKAILSDSSQKGFIKFI